eukprot:6015179-Prymnesium_polylepis.1
MAAAREGEWRAALALVDRMACSSLVLEAYASSALIAACGKAGEWRHALRLLDVRVGGRPTAACYTAAAAACGRARQWREALRVLSAMVRLWL